MRFGKSGSKDEKNYIHFTLNGVQYAVDGSISIPEDLSTVELCDLQFENGKFDGLYPGANAPYILSWNGETVYEENGAEFWLGAMITDDFLLVMSDGYVGNFYQKDSETGNLTLINIGALVK